MAFCAVRRQDAFHFHLLVAGDALAVVGPFESGFPRGNIRLLSVTGGALGRGHGGRTVVVTSRTHGQVGAVECLGHTVFARFFKHRFHHHPVGEL